MSNQDGTIAEIPTSWHSMSRLLGSGWVLSISVLPDDGDRPVFVACGRNGENLIRAEATTSREAWHRAVAAAAACGMLAGWPRPSQGRG
jgi:hypothetical protein